MEVRTVSWSIFCCLLKQNSLFNKAARSFSLRRVLELSSWKPPDAGAWHNTKNKQDHVLLLKELYRSYLTKNSTYFIFFNQSSRSKERKLKKNSEIKKKIPKKDHRFEFIVECQTCINKYVVIPCVYDSIAWAFKFGKYY